MTDVTVLDEGTIVLFTLESEPAHEWWRENVDPDAMTYCDAYVVEHRYAQPIITGLLDAGLEVENTQ
jgi:hypothetical protein